MYSDPRSNKFRLTVSPQSDRSPTFFPEQSAMFDVVLHNDGPDAAQVPSLDGNRETPNYGVYDAAGQMIIDVTPANLFAQFEAEMGEPEPEELSMIQIAPGAGKKTWIDLWSFTAPLAKGRYELQARHTVDAANAVIVESNRLAFEIVEARVDQLATGYENGKHEASVIAWLARPIEGGETPELLARLSVESNHGAAQRSGRSLGKVPAGSRLSLSEKPPGAQGSPLTWLAIVSSHDEGDNVELVQLQRATPKWRSGPIRLGLRGVSPIPRFADRQQALFLATGTTASGEAALTAVTMAPPQPGPTQWTMALQARPSATACAFATSGPIAILISSETDERTRLTRIDVEETGNISAAEREIRTSANRILSLTADMRPGAPPGFFVLEMDRLQAGKLTLISVPLQGEVEVRELGEVPGWPMREGRAAAADRVHLEIGRDGIPLIAMTDTQGDYYFGSLDGRPLTRMGRTDRGTFILAHIAALTERTAFSAFTDRGYLTHPGGR